MSIEWLASATTSKVVQLRPELMKQHQKHNLNSNYADGMRDYKGKAGSQSDLRIGQADLLLTNFKTMSGMPVITSMMIIS